MLGGRGWFFNDFICLENCEKYCIETNEWTAMSPMENKKMNASACLQGDDYIYVIGGYYGHQRQAYQALSDIERYDIDEDLWETLYVDGMAKRYLGFSFPISPTEVIICGGINFGSKKDAQLLDTEAETITPLGQELPKTDHFKNPSPLVLGRNQSELYAVGQSKTIYKYSKDTGKWAEVHLF